MNEQRAYDLVCRQLERANQTIDELIEIVRRAITNEYSFNDCPRTVNILSEALRKVGPR